MKTLLIDEFLRQEQTSTQITVTIEDKKLQGYQIAKPLNYDKRFTSFISRFFMAKNVLFGKAIAIQYFEDLSESERVSYIKSKTENR